MVEKNGDGLKISVFVIFRSIFFFFLLPDDYFGYILVNLNFVFIYKVKIFILKVFVVNGVFLKGLEYLPQ